MSDFATESGHWYRLDGAPCYTIVGANGKERPTTLRDAKKLGLVPSVTTIVRQAAAPGLERWKSEQLMLAALTLPRRPHEPESSWLARVREDSMAQGRKAADIGAEIHGAVESYYRNRESYAGKWINWVEVAVREIEKHCGKGHKWSPERSFAHPLGYGGKADLHCPEWTVDIKTKDWIENEKLWDEHPMQLAPYRRALAPESRAGILFVDRKQPAAKFIEVEPDLLTKGLAMFDALLAYFYAKSGYYLKVAA